MFRCATAWLRSLAPAASRRPAARRHRPAAEWLEDRVTPSGDPLASAVGLPPTGHTAGFLASPDQVDLYRLSLAAPGRLVAQVHAEVATRLALLGPGGDPLIESDG